ncbi:hypothetical protein SEPCBS119000_004416 [Sporothrix epigloea]|uniref:RNA-directed RNA polymerase n=1 Tax=Sporothrix epigloea TaxID=1892477 RepID=A0ABP0DTU0_9PEZI
MTVLLSGVPVQASTLDIYSSFAPLAVRKIDILEDSGRRTGKVRVQLLPPENDYWYDRCWTIQVESTPQLPTQASPPFIKVQARVDPGGFRSASEGILKTPSHRWGPAHKELELAMLGQGFLYQKRTMMVMDEVEKNCEDVQIKLKIAFGQRVLNIFVTRFLDNPHAARSNPNDTIPRNRRLKIDYRITVRFSWIKNVWEQQFSGGRVCIILALDSPPEYWRKTQDPAKSHNSDRLSWSDMDQWVRMAYLTNNQRAVRDASVSLRGFFPQNQAVDIGRWTTYRIGLNQSNVGEWHDLVGYLRDHDIRVKQCPEFRFLPRDDRSMWDCIRFDSSARLSNHDPSPENAISNVHHLSRSLSYEVAYQLEVCISRNILNESSLDVVFLESLAALTPDRATRTLEYVAERNKRIFQPHSIFRDPRAASYWRKSSPDSTLDKNRAVYIRKAIVTPTTIVYSTPSLEAGNRVLRHFREHHDRFLRVQFTDELLIGRLSGGRDGRRTDQCFARAFRALKHGIHVGNRHFKFLAFGNSQLRENSAYFFAPTDFLSCQDIRDWMGDFRGIKTVAKYAARLGQCLSTTRPVPTFGVPATIQRIADVHHGQFCYTDGVGKISMWWARAIASHLKIDFVPSAVQFRMGGCKGVLVAWPDVPSGQVVQIRPSQEKFPTLGSANVLEVVRCSETTTATLNQQTILLLSTLGVQPSVFLELLQEELAGLDAAMNSPDKAVDRLMLRVDQNHVTPVMADMVKAGFLTSDEPFVWAILQLWRSWSLKALKEKAHISLEKSAFVLGCVDETDTLRGHRSQEEETPAALDRHEDSETIDTERALALPQIFLQIPDLSDALQNGFHNLSRSDSRAYVALNDDRKYRVITGLCLVGRNPSLHPGDLRVVEAVDVPALRHLRNVVVFPRTGDRDIPSMCSGGDLDGDDYFVIWDHRLLPPHRFWNYKPMNFDSTREPDVDQVTPHDLISFFVKHMKHDTLPYIAISHRAYADQLEDGAMDMRCLELAQLHSQAVDYAKTGVPALMPHRLSPKEWPHWMERTFKRTYHSRTALGQIYDQVQVETFKPAYDKPFDRRILEHFPNLDVELMRCARRVKTRYDMVLRRAMAQKDIQSEFEMWSGFIMTKPRVGSDYKVAEDISRLFQVITSRFRRICIREASASQDAEKLRPFIAAMYRVTSEEVRIALHESALAYQRSVSTGRSNGRPPYRSMPLISFPWIFSHELCCLAKAADGSQPSQLVEGDDSMNKRLMSDVMNDGEEKQAARRIDKHGGLLTPKDLDEMEYKIQNGVPTHYGVPLDIPAYDSFRREEDEGDPDEAEFKPMWTLPPGKSEDDVVIDLVASVNSPEVRSDNEDEESYRRADYDFLATQTGRHRKHFVIPKHQNTTRNTPGGIPWIEIDEDFLSTTSEESGDEKMPQKIDIRRDENSAEEMESINDEKASRSKQDGDNANHGLPSNGPPNHLSDLMTLAENKPAVTPVGSTFFPPDVENDADDEDDIFDKVDGLFGDRTREET